jgi:hypothetical protein
MKHMHAGVLMDQEMDGQRRLSFYRLLLCRSLLLCCLALVCLSVSACGIKGDPFLSVPLAPAKVRALTAVARPGEILVQWQAPRDNMDETDLLDLAGFYVYRAQETFSDYCVKCPRTYDILFDYEYRGPSGLRPERRLYNFSDTAVKPGNVYMYRLRAYNAAGTSGPEGDPFVVYYDEALQTPQGFSVERKNRLIVLNWQPVGGLADGRAADDVFGYTVYRRTDSKEYGAALNAEPIAEVRFEDIPPADDTVYYYTVRAVRMHAKTIIESDASAEVRLEYYDITPPEAPRFLTPIGQPGGILLKWMAKTEKGFAGYHIYRRIAGRGEFKRLNQELLTVNSWLDTSAVKKRRYEYAVSAVDDSLSANESPLSDSVSLRYILN